MGGEKRIGGDREQVFQLLKIILIWETLRSLVLTGPTALVRGVTA